MARPAFFRAAVDDFLHAWFPPREKRRGERSHEAMDRAWCIGGELLQRV